MAATIAFSSKPCSGSREPARLGAASLPPHFGKWYTHYTRFHRWKRKQVWPDVMNALAADETCEYFYEEGAIRHAPTRRFVPRKPQQRRRQTKEPPEVQSGIERSGSEPSRCPT